MVRDNYQAGEEMGNRKAVKSDDLLGTTVSQDEYRGIFRIQADKTLKYHPGYGVPDRRSNVGFGDLDLQNTVPGAIDGELRWAVYNDAQRQDLAAVGPTFQSEDLRAAVASERTEKVLMPMHGIGTLEDGYLVLEIKADSGSDGDTVSPSDSAHDLGVTFTESRIRT